MQMVGGGLGGWGRKEGREGEDGEGGKRREDEAALGLGEGLMVGVGRRKRKERWEGVAVGRSSCGGWVVGGAEGGLHGVG